MNPTCANALAYPPPEAVGDTSVQMVADKHRSGIDEQAAVAIFRKSGQSVEIGGSRAVDPSQSIAINQSQSFASGSRWNRTANTRSRPKGRCISDAGPSATTWSLVQEHDPITEARSEVEIVHHNDNYRIPCQLLEPHDKVEPMPSRLAPGSSARIIAGHVAMIAASIVCDRAPP